MTHDPLCPVNGSIFIDDPYYCCQQCNPGDTPPWERNCQCILITKTRKATQDEIAMRVNNLAMDYILGLKDFGETADWLDSWNNAVLGKKS